MLLLVVVVADPSISDTSGSLNGVLYDARWAQAGGDRNATLNALDGLLIAFGGHFGVFGSSSCIALLIVIDDDALIVACCCCARLGVAPSGLIFSLLPIDAMVLNIPEGTFSFESSTKSKKAPFRDAVVVDDDGRD